jgi:hypothetical protein
MKDSNPGPHQEKAPVDLAERNAVAADFLHTSGLLFEMNRVVLHPLGLALAIWENDDGAIAGFAGLADNSDDPEGMIFSEETLRSGLERLRRYGVAEVRAERERLVGFVIQPLPKEP